jgi:hypothetical protein
VLRLSFRFQLSIETPILFSQIFPLDQSVETKALTIAIYFLLSDPGTLLRETLPDLITR